MFWVLVLSLFLPSYRFGQPISMDPFIDQFLSSEEGAARAAVKRLTATIERELVEATINAPDWYDVLEVCRRTHP